MKKTILKILLITLIMILTIILLQTISNAANLSISTSKSNVSPGETFSVTVSLSGAAGPVSASVSNASGALNNQWLENSSQTFTCTAGSSGTISISASGTVGDFSTGEDVYVSASKSVTIIEPTPVVPTLSSNANLSNLGINPYDFRGFKASKTSYSVSVPNDVSSISIYAYAQDSKASVTGTGSKSLKIGTNTFNVTVKAEDGTTKTYTLYITRKAENVAQEEPTKSSDTSLVSLAVAEGALTPEFNTSVKEYIVNVPEEIVEVSITGVPNHNNAIVTIEGGKELQLGENMVTITITAEDGTVGTYTLKIIRGNMKIALQALVIGYINEEGQLIELPLSPIFNEDVLEYELEDLDYNIDKLKIDALPTNSGLVVEIKGNEELKTGENIITIIVRKEPTNELEVVQEVEYKIIVNKQTKPEEQTIGIIGNITNWFKSLPGIIGNFLETNEQMIIVSSLSLCVVAMIGLSIYIIIDYRKYKMILAKLSTLVKANSEMPNTENIKNETPKKLEE